MSAEEREATQRFRRERAPHQRALAHEGRAPGARHGVHSERRGLPQRRGVPQRLPEAPHPGDPRVVGAKMPPASQPQPQGRDLLFYVRLGYIYIHGSQRKKVEEEGTRGLPMGSELRCVALLGEEKEEFEISKHKTHS